MTAHAENGWGAVDEEEVRRVINAAAWREGCVIALIDGPERAEAAIGLQPAKSWYGTDRDWFWTELLFYVHPDHRRSRHAEALFRFAKEWARNSGSPVRIDVQPRHGLGRKVRLFARHGRLVSASFLFTPGLE